MAQRARVTGRSVRREGVAVGHVVIDDFDYSIYSLWNSMLNRHEEFLDRFDSVPLTVEEWKQQREIYRRRDEPGLDKLDLVFATSYLNRTNQSGVLGGGMIGGPKQQGTYKLDARLNKETLRERIEAVGKHRSKISASSSAAALPSSAETDAHECFPSDACARRQRSARRL